MKKIIIAAIGIIASTAAFQIFAQQNSFSNTDRSEERRVGKEC